eukprot:1734072-Prymnesium_polylepis.2
MPLQVRLALSAGTRIAMIHENDEAKSGCPFYVCVAHAQPASSCLATALNHSHLPRRADLTLRSRSMK